MTPGKAQTLIVTSLAVSGGLVVVKDAKAGQLPGARLAIGLTFTGVSLGVLAQFSPDLAGGVALLLLTTSVFVYGGPAFLAISGSLATTPTNVLLPNSPRIQDGRAPLST